MQRARFEVRGTVQGVGFRPFVYRLGALLGVSGWVRNAGWGVCVEVEGPTSTLDDFAARLVGEAPPAARIEGVTRTAQPVQGGSTWRIEPSALGDVATGVQADMVPCGECVRELFDPHARRFRYPFSSCTQCGPRFTIVRALPYDRSRTALDVFPLCAACRREFEDPADRRFHAQPLACPDCGPQLAWWGPGGGTLGAGAAALASATAQLAGGGVIAAKGCGGFQLLCRADMDEPVGRIRRLKQRARKPLAVMVGDLGAARALCRLEEGEEALLASAAGPIVLAAARGAGVSEDVAPGRTTLGVMLPSTLLHHVLLHDVGVPLVVTSGNVQGEPMPGAGDEALATFGGVVDGFLVHDREIVHVVDDSVVRWAAGRPLLLRRARGYAPLPVHVDPGLGPNAPVLAHGGHLKAVVAVGQGSPAWVSPHVGDLDTPRARAAYAATEAGLLARRGVTPVVGACDLHPDYASTRRAEASGRALVRVQHHEAHVLSVVAERSVALPALGVAWDGGGWGTDGTVWGGEAFEVTSDTIRRVARLRPFPLPGGDRAVREPRRAALGLLWSWDPQRVWDGPLRGAFSEVERRVLPRGLVQGVNAPWCSSVGRLFDAVASLTGLHQRCDHEAEAACAVEDAVDAEELGAYRFGLDARGGLLELDWRPALEALLRDVDAEESVGRVAARVHRGLAVWLLELAQAVGLRRVVLGGGCFANRVLLEGAVARLRAGGCEVDWPAQLPPGDGGLALGQLAAAARQGW